MQDAQIKPDTTNPENIKPPRWQLFIDAGADVNACTKQGENMLFYLVSSNHFQKSDFPFLFKNLRDLIENRGVIPKKAKNGGTLFHRLARFHPECFSVEEWTQLCAYVNIFYKISDAYFVVGLVTGAVFEETPLDIVNIFWTDPRNEHPIKMFCRDQESSESKDLLQKATLSYVSMAGNGKSVLTCPSYAYDLRDETVKEKVKNNNIFPTLRAREFGLVRAKIKTPQQMLLQ